MRVLLLHKPFGLQNTTRRILHFTLRVTLLNFKTPASWIGSVCNHCYVPNRNALAFGYAKEAPEGTSHEALVCNNSNPEAILNFLDTDVLREVL